VFEYINCMLKDTNVFLWRRVLDFVLTRKQPQWSGFPDRCRF